MVVVFGTLTAGQVDVVDKRFSVATEFFHIMWFPIAPVGTQVIMDRKVAKRFGMLDETAAESPQPEADADTGETDESDLHRNLTCPSDGSTRLPCRPRVSPATSRVIPPMRRACRPTSRPEPPSPRQDRHRVLSWFQLIEHLELERVGAQIGPVGL